MEFAQPEWLYALILVPLPLLWWWRQQRRTPGMRYSTTRVLQDLPTSWRQRLRILVPLLQSLVLAFGILALARPQLRNSHIERYTEGIDIMLVLDTSTSMRAEDFKPNRFKAAQSVAAEFIRNRISDRIGLIVFAEQAYTQVPLTLDYDFLLQMLQQVKTGAIQDGTAIGTALATAVSRLKDSSAKSKVIILLTDGQNNRGEIDPETAAEIAASRNIRVYTIGVGARGTAPYTFDHPYYGKITRNIPVEIDEQMLRTVAQKTGGRYFRATDNQALKAIYDEIGQLEKTKIQERVFVDYEEKYPVFLWPAILLATLSILLTSTYFRTWP